jgi:hypothetical protein
LGSADQLGALKIHRNQFSESTAEIDENGEGAHTQLSVHQFASDQSYSAAI